MKNLAGKVAGECEALGAETLLCRADVASDQACRDMAAQTLGKWGHIDILVNNAGITRFCEHSHLEGLDAQDFQSIYGVNVIGAFQMIRAVSPTPPPRAH